MSMAISNRGSALNCCISRKYIITMYQFVLANAEETLNKTHSALPYSGQVVFFGECSGQVVYILLSAKLCETYKMSKKSLCNTILMTIMQLDCEFFFDFPV